MGKQRFPNFVWAGAVCALGIALGSCTPGGQFDPTEVFSNKIFDTKKPLPGDREPLFPNGVPGAETGVPPDLVKGYQPPAEQAATSPEAAPKPVAAAEEKPKPKPRAKPKPKPALAKASPAVPQKPPTANSAWPAPPQPAAQTNWPAPPGATQASGPAQTNWPPPPGSTQASGPAQTNWPPPPGAQTQQGAQSGQTVWPNPPGAATSSH